MRNDNPYRNYDISVEVLSDEHAVVAQASLRDEQPDPSSFDRYETCITTVTHTGSSKREPGDRRNPDVGRKLAVARALKSLAQELEDVAQAEIKALYGEP